MTNHTRLTQTVPLAVLALAVLAACAGAPTPIPNPDSPNGRLFAERCGSCHAVPHPKRHTAAKWGPILDLMQRRMIEREVPPLSIDERHRIEAYLTENGR